MTEYTMKHVSCLEQMSMLTNSGPHIYYLLKNEAVVYVGQSVNYASRVLHHTHDKDFDCFCISQPDNNMTVNECEFIEIVRYLPKYNKSLPPVEFLLSQNALNNLCVTSHRVDRHGKMFDHSAPEYTIQVGNITCRYWSIPGFDYKNVPDPTRPGNVEKPDGRGVFLMKHLADEINFDKGGSIVNLKFRI